MDAPSKIRVNQVGYALHFPQIVTVLTDSPLILRDACGKELGRIAPPPLQWDEASGERAASVSLSLPVRTGRCWTRTP